MERREEVAVAQDSAYNLEHWGAWVMALAAIVLGVMGLLGAFEIVDFHDYAAQEAALGEGTVGDVRSVSTDSFWDGVLFLTLAVSAAFLALCLHNNDHHRTGAPRGGTSEGSLWMGEHSAAYLMALAAVALGVIALLAGFDAFGSGTDQRDGVIWGLTSLGASVLTTTLHAVRHHQVAAEEDHMLVMVRERLVRPEPGTAGTQRAPERR